MIEIMFVGFIFGVAIARIFEMMEA